MDIEKFVKEEMARRNEWVKRELFKPDGGILGRRLIDHKEIPREEPSLVTIELTFAGGEPLTCRYRRVSREEWTDMACRGKLDLRCAYVEEFNYPKLQQAYSLRGELVCTAAGTFFQGEAHFENMKFRDKASFYLSQFMGSADFGEVQFDGDADFRLAQFGGGADFRLAHFESNVNFGEVYFDGGADFVGAHFDSSADFGEVQFDGGANFQMARFDGNTAFQWVHFNSSADFSRARFTQDVDFLWAHFDGDAEFMQARLGGDAHFVGAHFGGDADFELAHFESDVHFSLAHFDRKADFSRAHFGSDADFWKMHFGGDASFLEAHFGDSVFFVYAYFDSAAEFREAHFSGRAQFLWTLFQRELTFLDVEAPKVEIQECTFSGHVNLCFKHVEYLGIQKCIVEKTIDLRASKDSYNPNIEILSLKDTRNLGRIDCDWEAGKIEKAIKDNENDDWASKAQQFSVLKEHFHNVGDYGAEDGAFVAHMQARRQAAIETRGRDKEEKRAEKRAERDKKKRRKPEVATEPEKATEPGKATEPEVATEPEKAAEPGKAKKPKKQTFWVVKVILDWLVDKAGRYGTSPGRVAVSMGIVWLVFTAIYMLLYLKGGCPWFAGSDMHSLWDGWYVSAAAFLTIGGNFAGTALGVKILGITEGFLGLFFMAYFTVAVVRKTLR